MKRQPRRARRCVLSEKMPDLLLLFPSAGVKSPLTGYTCICVCLWLRQILSGTKDIQILTESEIFIRRIFCLSIRELFRDSRNEGWPETARRRTLRKHRHVTTSPAASLPVVARCTASCRPLPSPPARYAPAPSPHHLSAKFHPRFGGMQRMEASFRDGRVPKTRRRRDARAATRLHRRTMSMRRNHACAPPRVVVPSMRSSPVDARVRDPALEATRLKFFHGAAAKPSLVPSPLDRPGSRGQGDQPPRHPRGPRPRRDPQGPRRRQAAHLRHEVPHEDPGGHRHRRRRGWRHPRPPW